MSDYNRIIVADDERQQTIDLPTSNIVAPETDIYDEPVRWYKANQEWASIIEGHLNWLTDITAWKNAEDENHIAPQSIMKFIEGQEGIIMGTVEEICEGVLCALGKAGQLLAGGVNSGDLTFTIDDNGNVVIGEETSGGQLTVLQSQQRMAACESVIDGWSDYIDDFEEFRVSSGDDPAIMETLLTLKYSVNAGITTAITDYIAHRNSGSPSFSYSTGAGAMARYLYCEGVTKQVVATYVIDNDSIDPLLLGLEMIDALQQEQYDIWFDSVGDDVSDDYLNAPCFRYQPVTYVYTPAFFADKEGDIFVPSPSIVFGREYLIEVSGELTATNGANIDKWDGMYRTINGNSAFDPLVFRNTTNSATTGSPNVTPQQSSTGYSVVYDVVTASRIRFPNFDDGLAWSGQLTFKIIDKGSL